MTAASVVAVYSSVQGDGGNSGNGVTTDGNPTTNDYLVVCLCGAANADAMTPPVGWAEITVPDNSIAIGGGAIRAYWLKNPATATTYTWTLSSGRRSAVGLLVRAADGTTLVDVASSLQSVPGANHTPPAITTAGNDRLIIDFAGLRQFSPDTAGWTVPASGLTWTEQADVQGADSNNNIRLAAGTATAATTGAVSTAVWTQTDVNEESIIIRIAITPASAGGAAALATVPIVAPSAAAIRATW